MKNTIYLLCIFFTMGLQAQDFNEIIETYLTQNRSQLAFSTNDISDIEIKSSHFSKSTKSDLIYTVQRLNGIEIFNAISNFVITNNEVKKMQNGFISQISQKSNSSSPSLTPVEAIMAAAGHLSIGNPADLTLLNTLEGNKYIFSDGGISQENINVKLVYQPDEDKTLLRLAWDLDIFLKDGTHWYSTRIDAQTGKLLSLHDWGNTCNYNQDGTQDIISRGSEKASILFKNHSGVSSFSPNDASQYRVIALPNESPNHGMDEVVNEPADAIASPFGWHDTNGVPGPEFTITRGNNVWARADLSGNNTGNSPEGGSNLDFDFPLNFNQQPIGFVDAATTNLFYMNNIAHDIFYRYGFDEASGNFQQTNYTGLGLGNDAVNADAQDGSGLNNASFFSPPEGNSPRLQMFVWNAQGPPGEPLTINNGTLTGSYQAGRAAFGPPLPSSPITAQIVLVKDNNAGPSIDANDGCDAITNRAEITGKIAVIRRGECQFTYKVLKAQNEGAIAAIIVNNVPGAPITMSGGNNSGSINIPSVMLNQANGEALINALLNGEVINGTLEETGPFQIDGTLDNVIIAHEYGHGVSNRLTGGAFNSGCLQNREQMGEGWSDYLGLILTMKATDTPGQRRGIGTYVTGQPVNGNGIRPAPYSTNFAINNFTYGDTNNQNLSRPHGVGFVWATMLWDLTWALVDQYGFDTDIYNGTGGNNIALQLVMDGLKLQPCSPGFVDGRDAILLADELANNGDNKCLIWNVFANRGLGLSADQGDTDNRYDQTEAFDVPQECSLGVQGNSSVEFSIYPNPSDGTIYISSQKETGEGIASIFDLNGRLVHKSDISFANTATVVANNLKTGFYILQLNGDGFSHTTKLIIK